MYPSIASAVQVELVVNEAGMAMLLHEKDLPASPEWVEYDPSLPELYLHYADESAQPVGLRLSQNMVNYLKNSEELVRLQLVNKVVKAYQPLKIITRR